MSELEGHRLLIPGLNTQGAGAHFPTSVAAVVVMRNRENVSDVGNGLGLGLVVSKA